MTNDNKFFLTSNNFLNPNVGKGITVIGIGIPFLGIAFEHIKIISAIIGIILIIAGLIVIFKEPISLQSFIKKKIKDAKILQLSPTLSIENINMFRNQLNSKIKTSTGKSIFEDRDSELKISTMYKNTDNMIKTLDNYIRILEKIC